MTERLQQPVLNMLTQLSRFLQVGAVGFAVDAAVLWMLVYQMGMPPVLARVFSFLAAITVTFVLNARYTFAVPLRQSSKSRYLLVQCSGGLVNFGSYSALVLFGLLGPLWALVVGSALSSAHNFVMVRRFVYPTDSRPA